MTTPTGAIPRDLETRLRDIERGLREAKTAAMSRPQMGVSAGDFVVSGGAVIVDGGDFLLLDTDGSTIVRLGPQTWGDRGFSVSRENGVPALELRKLFENSTEQNLELRNRQGHVIAAEATFGDGREVPYQTLPFQPAPPVAAAVNAGPHGWEVATTSATFATVHRAQFLRENTYSRWEFAVATSDTTTAAEVQVINEATGATLDGFFQPPWVGSVPVGATTYRVVTPAYGLTLPGDYLATCKLAVQARRTAGAGTVRVAVRQAQGGSA